MSRGTPETGPLRRATPPSLQPPAWVRDLVGDPAPVAGENLPPGASLRIAAGDGLALLTVDLPAAAKLDDEEFHLAVEESYVALARELRSRSLRPLRFWNWLPEIGASWQGGLTGYELFNRARWSAFQRREVARLGEWGRVAASAVDPRMGSFAIHVLAGERPATAIDNPRQIEPHDYSARYGPVPPRFARGVVLPGDLVSRHGLPQALVSGTASIVGEQTQHAGDLVAQLEEVAVNLASVVLALRGRATPRPAGSRLDDDLRSALAAYASLRVYVPQHGSEPDIRAWIGELFDLDRPAEIVAADLCRSDLLVEVEGTVPRARGARTPRRRSPERRRRLRSS